MLWCSLCAGKLEWGYLNVGARALWHPRQWKGWWNCSAGCNIAVIWPTASPWNTDVCNKRRRLKYWAVIEHYIAWNNLPGHKHGKHFISRPCKQSAEELLKLSRYQPRVVVELLMEHVPVKKHLNSMGLLDGNLDCRFCKVYTENCVPCYLLLWGLGSSVL